MARRYLADLFPRGRDSAPSAFSAPVSQTAAGSAALARRADFTLGRAQVCPATHTVSGPGGAAKIEPMVMRVLIAFADAGGKVLTRDDLIRDHWGGRFVGEDAVNRVIGEVRRVARGPAAESFSIETIPKTGWRLVIEGEPAGAARLTIARRPLIAAGAATAVAAVAGLTGWRYFAGESESASDGVRHSVAVLPFASLSPGADDEYLADGVSGEIINALAALPELRITGRTSSFYFKDRNVPPAEIGQALGVEHLVDGSVRRAGDQVRIIAELVRVSDGVQIWSQRYDRPASDILLIQSDIAERVARALEIVLDETARARMLRSGTSNVEAFEAYLAGRRLYERAHAEDIFLLPRANVQFERALALDPQYFAPSLAHSDLYWHVLFNQLDFGSDSSAGSLSPAQAHARYMRDMTRAAANAQSPLDRTAILLYRSVMSPSWRQVPELIRDLKSQKVSRLTSETAGSLDSILLPAGETDLVTSIGNGLIRSDPFQAHGYMVAAKAAIWKGRPESALAIIQRGRERIGEHFFFYLMDMYAAAHIGRAEVIASLQEYARERPGEEPRAFLLSLLGNNAEAMRIAERAFAAGNFEGGGLVSTYYQIGNRKRLRQTVRALDAQIAGPAELANLISICGGLQFDIADAPNFAARLLEADIDPSGLKSYPRYPA